MGSSQNSSSSHQKNRDQLERAREIIHLLIKSFSQMKIFSSRHRNVLEFTDQLYGKVKEFLNLHRVLEIGIEEFSFSMDGKVFYTDKEINHSLPFLFYKDGMKMLYIYSDLQKQEFLDFLDIIKQESILPAEESDIVSAFWERDFANIRYFAPDEYLESKIGLETGVLDYSVNKNDLFSGRIELDEEDRTALSQSDGLIQTILQQNKDTFDSDDLDPKDRPALPILSPGEMQALESMLESSRQASPDDELISLLFEMLYLEKRAQEFTQNLEILKHCMIKIIKQGDFARILETYSTLVELSEELGKDSAEKRKDMDDIIDYFKSEGSLADLKQTALKGGIKDKGAFLEYLKLLGPETLPLQSALYHAEKNPLFQKQILNIIKETGRRNPDILFRLGRDDDPELTTEIIAIIQTLDEKQSVALLTRFFRFTNKTIRMATIRALSHFHGSNSENILLGYIADPDPELRTLALKSLTYSGDRKTLDRILQITKDKEFEKKSRQEKQAFFGFLVSTGQEEGYAVLTSYLKKIGLFARADLVDTALAAVSILNQNESPEAGRILSRFSSCRHRRIREACRQNDKQGKSTA